MHSNSTNSKLQKCVCAGMLAIHFASYCGLVKFSDGGKEGGRREGIQREGGGGGGLVF